MEENIKQVSTLVEVLRHRSELQPDELAYTFIKGDEAEEPGITYRQLDQRARAIAVRLQAMMSPGERALVVYRAGLDSIAAFFGCLYAGVVAVPICPPWHERSEARFEAIATNAQASVLLTSAELLSGREGWLTETSETRNLSWLATNDLDTETASNWQMPDIHGDTLAFLRYTASFTDTPKGIMLSHGNLLHNLAYMASLWPSEPKSAMVSWLPIFHGMGLAFGMLQPLYQGFPCYLMSPAAVMQRPVRWLAAISRYKATHTGAPNFAYGLCVEKITEKQRASLDLSSLVVSLNSAEPVRAEAFEKFTEYFKPCGLAPTALRHGYGLAEATLMVGGAKKQELPVYYRVRNDELDRHRVLTAEDERSAQHLIGCGHPAADAKLIIVNPDTLTRCQPDEIGEIWLSSPSVAQGYWHKPTETESTFRAYLAGTDEGPFLRTGDLGFLKDGELFITGRLKDLIILYGQSHSPDDIEGSVERVVDFVKSKGCVATSITVDGQEKLVMVVEADAELIRCVEAVREQQAPSQGMSSLWSGKQIEELASARETLDRQIGVIAARMREAVAREHEVSLYALAFVAPECFPRAANGKVERHACRSLFLERKDKVLFFWYEYDETGEAEKRPVDDDSSHYMRIEEQEPSLNPIRELIHDCLVDYLKREQHLGVDRIDYDRSFASLGIDSLGMVMIREALEKRLGEELNLDTLFYELDTVNKLYESVLSNTKHAVFEHTLTIPQMDPLAVVATLIGDHADEDYYVYEKPADACWHIALGVHAALTLTPSTMTFNHFNRPTVMRDREWKESIPAVARRFFQSEGGGGWNMYGQAAFEYAAQVRGIPSAGASEEDWPLLSLMVPRNEVTVRHHNATTSITIRTREIETLTAIQTLLSSNTQLRFDDKVCPIDTESGKDSYQQMVGRAVDEIRTGSYEKVILSRQIRLPERMDMLKTYLLARPKHTPSRSFLIKFMERQVLGFSPELVMAVQGRDVITQPLAGTRALGTADNADIRHELLTDPKEVVEHAISVREAVKEMELISQRVSVDGFMSILERGSAQHIASKVTGTLKDDKDAWDAFDVLFPAITASGIPKTDSIEVILRMEEQSRGLYSGAVLMLNDKGFEASLVLRSAFQEPGKTWIQAGAGLIELSNPEREFMETKEKLASIAPYVVSEN